MKKYTKVIEPLFPEFEVAYPNSIVMEDCWIHTGDKFVRNKRTSEVHEILEVTYGQQMVNHAPKSKPEWLRNEWVYPVNMWQNHKVSILRITGKENIQTGDLLEII